MMLREPSEASRHRENAMGDPSTMLSFDEYIRHWGAARPTAVALEEGDERATFADL